MATWTKRISCSTEEYPSWLYPVKQGATTIWERWDGQKPDGTFQDKGMNSYNHMPTVRSAIGCIASWRASRSTAAPGYKHVLIQPQPGGGFNSVKASHTSLYGKIGSAWSLENGTFELIVDVPPNTTATVRLPGAQATGVMESGRALAPGNGVSAVRQDGDVAVAEVGSGQYPLHIPDGGPGTDERTARTIGPLGSAHAPATLVRQLCATPCHQSCEGCWPRNAHLAGQSVADARYAPRNPRLHTHMAVRPRSRIGPTTLSPV